ncbi:shikimate dehydrogenase family protein [Aspergillus vadensis CBS 113365]|uniref:Quinate 5-dehydrogenase n=1 Tax=Aspergillus vadensis (strain CBS 113365 / IMI 142717 / IBT 24658) TaxID=1448311 RepID=A0A319CZI2_ASPVC|nr:quinate 5-dehydrogenase [Aspergillus vadensis CBS 113365]PYH73352.1 quinate 5-dehydrogenase [Aspergillus vadensis CBS 113365]
MTQPLVFHVFGGPNIRASLSPTIHNAAFTHHRLPHTYTVAECTSLSEVSQLITSPSFGGASITMPHKLAAFEHCTQVSDSARAIGAINTLLTTRSPNGNGAVKVTGDNTDWSGLYTLIIDYLSQQGIHSGKGTGKVGLVIGAGGAARAAVYALLQAEFSTIIIWNRTVGKAEDIVGDFDALRCGGNDVEMRAVGDVDGIGPVDVVIGTIPGDVKNEEDFEGLFQESKTGLCVEMAYKPKVTPLMKVAERRGWVVRDGLEVLLRQGFEQYRLWTKLDAPEGVMREAIGENGVKSKV